MIRTNAGPAYLTADQIAQAIAWREAGLTFDAIGELLGRHRTTVWKALRRRGHGGPPRPFRAWTRKEQLRCLELFASGLKRPAIARRMGRSHTSVCHVIRQARRGEATSE